MFKEGQKVVVLDQLGDSVTGDGWEEYVFGNNMAKYIGKVFRVYSVEGNWIRLAESAESGGEDVDPRIMWHKTWLGKVTRKTLLELRRKEETINYAKTTQDKLL